MNKENISLVINCQKEDIENIDMAYFNDKYARIYFNIKPDNKKYLDKIINNIETEYYSILNFNQKYKNTNNLKIYSKNNYCSFINNLSSINIYNTLKFSKFVLITSNLEIINQQEIINKLKKIENIILTNKIYCIYDNNYIILSHNLIYYFPLKYLSFSSIDNFYLTIKKYKLSTLVLSQDIPIDNICNINDLSIHLLIHNIGYQLYEIIKYLKENITDYIYIYNIKSYDGIDYQLLSEYYNCNYEYIDDNNLEQIMNILENNKVKDIKNFLCINLVDDKDHSTINIFNIIQNNNYKNIHFKF